MLEGNSPNCSRLPHRYAISSPFFAAYFIISSAVLTDLFFDATNFSSHHNNCDTVSTGGERSRDRWRNSQPSGVLSGGKCDYPWNSRSQGEKSWDQSAAAHGGYGNAGAIEKMEPGQERPDARGSRH